MSFAQVAKELREETGLSQHNLGLKLGLSSSGIAHLELGQREPGSSTILAYAKYFGVTTDYLLGLEDDFGARVPAAPPATMGDMHSSDLTQKEKALLEAFGKLLPETQDFILRTAQSLSDVKENSLKKF